MIFKEVKEVREVREGNEKDSFDYGGNGSGWQLPE